MDAASTESSTIASADRTPEPAACPRCNDNLPPLPPVASQALDGARVRRCLHCGTRSTETPVRRLVFSCESCGLPFATDDLLPHAQRLCAGCRDGEPPRPLPDAAAVTATEAEVRRALARRWRFVTSATATPYLGRVARQVARRVEGAPEESSVILIDEPALRSLALPSGTLLVSTGLITFLEDEAELVFVLAHELAHSASGDAAVRLVRLGFDAVVRGREAPTSEAWVSAAEDLARHGYGRQRERDADTRAIETTLALDYDPESAGRFLTRLQAAIDRADPEVAETCVAHPPPIDRMRRIERAMWGKMHEGRVLRVNREVFRRVATRASLAATLVPIGLPEIRFDRSAPGTPARGRIQRPRNRRAAWAIVAAAALLALAGAAIYLTL